MERIEFNTGRQYTAQGQIVVALLLKTEVDEIFPGCDLTTCTVEFHDKSRHVAGTIQVNAFTEQEIMGAYDRGAYNSIQLDLHA